MRYRTTFGSYAVILGLGPTGIGLATLSSALQGSWPMAGLGVALLCVFGWILLGTRYVVGQDVLDVRMGPLRRRIPLNDVTGIHRHRMVDGWMLGLGSDFISIEFGQRPAVNVSPRNPDGFIEAVTQGSERPRSRPDRSDLASGPQSTDGAQL